MLISDWSSDVCSSDLSVWCPGPAGGASCSNCHCRLVPAIHVRIRLRTSLERHGATAEWALGTSPRATTGAVVDTHISCGGQLPPVLPPQRHARGTGGAAGTERGCKDG